MNTIRRRVVLALPLAVILVSPASARAGETTVAGSGATSAVPGAGTPITEALAARLAAGRCDRWASSSAMNASDENGGTAASPFRTVQRLWNSLAAGQTGCLRGGDVFTPARQVVLFVPTTGGGTSGSPKILRTDPASGSAAELRGTIEVRGRDVVLAGLRLNGWSDTLNASAFIIRGDRIALLGNDITTNGTRICVDVGYRMMEDFGRLARDVVIDGNRIHHCGNNAEPGSGEHGIYLQQSLRARVTNNFIYRNQDRGLQVYFESDHARIANNVFDRNGSNLHIGGRLYERTGYNGNGLSNRYSDHTVLDRNIVSNATLATRNSYRWSVETFWARDAAMNSGTIDAVTTQDLLQNSCVYQAPSATGPSDRTILPVAWGRSGLDLAGNFVGTDAAHDPRFRGSATGDYRLQSTSPCRGKGPLPGAFTRPASPVRATSASLRGIGPALAHGDRAIPVRQDDVLWEDIVERGDDGLPAAERGDRCHRPVTGDAVPLPDRRHELVGDHVRSRQDVPDAGQQLARMDDARAA